MLVVGGYAVYVLRPDERRRLFVHAAGRVSAGMSMLRRHAPAREPDAFDEALRARVGTPYLSVAVLVLNVATLLSMLLTGRWGDSNALLALGGSVGPLTTNGDWWRLVTTTFVHAGVLAFVIEMAALAQAGVLVERLFGHLAFAGVYLASAVLAGTIGLWADPLAISVGASAPIFALYGLLCAHVVRGTLRRTPLTLSRRVIGRIGPVALLFVANSMMHGGEAWRAGLATFVIGFAIGLALTRGMAERTPGALRVLPLAGATLSIAIAIVTPLKGMIDVRAELARLLTTEEHISARYRAATAQFTRGAIKADVLAQLIDRSIVPELDAVRRQLDAIEGVPPQQHSLVASAAEYLRLRRESWTVRADALHRSNLRLLRDADQKERASAAALEKLRPALVDGAGS
jgi:rhomboid protease GluP